MFRDRSPSLTEISENFRGRKLGNIGGSTPGVVTGAEGGAGAWERGEERGVNLAWARP